jgi:hypothetical protein
MSDDIHELLSLSGIAALIIFTSSMIVFSALEPGYNHLEGTMSVLGGIPGWRGTAFQISGALTGGLLICLAVRMRVVKESTPSFQVGRSLIALGGVGMIGSALFHCSLDCRNILIQPTPSGRLHILFSFLTGSSLAIAPLVSYPFLAHHRWAHLRHVTLITGLLGNLFGIILCVSFLTTRLAGLEGLVQRLGIIFPMIWIALVSINLFMITHHD